MHDKNPFVCHVDDRRHLLATKIDSSYRRNDNAFSTICILSCTQNLTSLQNKKIPLFRTGFYLSFHNTHYAYRNTKH